ncbi:hypothetical protein GCM10022226_28320 [Sphaerisporangium flaviroseum]|uniref:MCE family protein n=1 Tax=Sphaerisporangium flaviroseum TaxID=509199 RepID=A0ABP7I062_9ACTN
MRVRILVNLVFFAILGVVMTVWAFTSIIKLDVITKPYRVTAEFESSPGLVDGVEVAYLGVRVGKVGDIRLAPGKIVIGLDIDRDTRLPQGVTAEIRRKSAIGEPYVELSPPSKGTGGPALAAGDVIPLAKTSVPIDYKKVFDGVGKLLDSVPADDARTIVHEVATGLDGRAPALRGIIDDAHDLTGTLAENADLLDDLSGQLTRLTGTLAGKREKLAGGISDLSAVTASLRASRRDLNTILDRGPGVFGQIDHLLKTARPGFSCLLTASAEHPGTVFTPGNERYVHHVLSIIPTAVAFADDITEKRADGVYARVTFIFSVPGGPKVAEEYEHPLAPPKVPRLRHCPKPPKNYDDDSSPVSVSAPRDVPPTSDRGSGSGGTGSGSDGTGSGSNGTGSRGGGSGRNGSASDGNGTAAPGGEPSRTGEDTAAGARPDSDVTPFIVLIFLAVVISGGVLGWIAVGRSSRRR